MKDPIRAISKNDLPDLKSVIETSGLFPTELLDGMVAEYFANPETQDIWLTKEIDEKPMAIAYCGPERLTDGTFNLFLIAVHGTVQGRGIGGEMLDYLEHVLKSQGTRILLVETSGLPDFELTRRFYIKNGYIQEATIRDFYKDGEDKIVFWKRLN